MVFTVLESNSGTHPAIQVSLHWAIILALQIQTHRCTPTHLYCGGKWTAQAKPHRKLQAPSSAHPSFSTADATAFFFSLMKKMSPFSSSHWHLQVFEVLLLFVTLWAHELIVLWLTEAIIDSVAQLVSNLAPETPLTGSRIFLTYLLDLWAVPGLSLLPLTERHL